MIKHSWYIPHKHRLMQYIPCMHTVACDHTTVYPHSCTLDPSSVQYVLQTLFESEIKPHLETEFVISTSTIPETSLGRGEHRYNTHHVEEALLPCMYTGVTRHSVAFCSAVKEQLLALSSIRTFTVRWKIRILLATYYLQPPLQCFFAFQHSGSDKTHTWS